MPFTVFNVPDLSETTTTVKKGTVPLVAPATPSPPTAGLIVPRGTKNTAG